MGSATLDWLGCATFRLSVDGLIVFLDAYIDRVPSAPATGLAVADVDQADWVVVGHSHFDHLWGAERIARRTGATIVGSYETTRIMQTQGVSAEQLLSVAGGERVRLSPSVTVSIYPGIHSCVWSHMRFAQPDEVCLGDLGLTHQERLARLGEFRQHAASLGEDVRAHLQAANQGDRGDGGALLYWFDTPEGSLLFQDTCGYHTGVLSMLHPDVAILAAAGRGNIDGEPVQGSLAEFVAGEIKLLQPQRVILGHHDDWLPGLTVPTNTAPIRAAVADVAPETELVEMGYRSGYPVFANLTVVSRPVRPG
jgi:L-ascorbate metabolism protein UlaG (beta-lactamase superfamily)